MTSAERTEILNRIDLARDFEEHHCSYRDPRTNVLCAEQEHDPFSGRCEAHRHF